MKKLISLLVLVLVAASFTGCARTLKTCDVKDLDGTIVCYDENWNNTPLKKARLWLSTWTMTRSEMR